MWTHLYFQAYVQNADGPVEVPEESRRGSSPPSTIQAAGLSHGLDQKAASAKMLYSTRKLYFLDAFSSSAVTTYHFIIDARDNLGRLHKIFENIWSDRE